MSSPDQFSDEFRWLDEHMIESFKTPDEAFDRVHMLSPEDWQFFDKVWAERPAHWREAFAYVVVDGPVSRAQPLLRRALFDADHSVATQAAISLCHQLTEYPSECPFDETLLPRLREIRRTSSGDMQEVDIVLGRYDAS